MPRNKKNTDDEIRNNKNCSVISLKHNSNNRRAAENKGNKSVGGGRDRLSKWPGNKNN